MYRVRGQINFIKSNIHYLDGINRIVAFAEGEGRNAVLLARKGFEVTAWVYAKNGLKNNTISFST